MSEDIQVSVDSGVAHVTLSRPDRHNAFTQDMHVQFGRILDDVGADAQVRAIVLSGEGKSFCSGMDVSMIGQRAPGDTHPAYLSRLQAVRLNQLKSAKPIVAALKGAVFGLGCEIALACDIRVAADDLKMSVPEVDMGLITDTGGLPLLSAIVGPARARYMILTAARIDAETALSWGAVEFVVPVGTVEERATAIARSIADKPPLAVAAARRVLDDLTLGDVQAGMSAELSAQVALFATEDHAEARRAFRARETPRFSGR